MHRSRSAQTVARLLALALAVGSITLVEALAAVPADAAKPGWTWPLQPRPLVVRPFQPPAESWSAGHRGVDLRGDPLQPVLAVAAGLVTFAGVIAGRGVVVVRHGSLRSTYEPVTAAVRVGQAVAAGAAVGLLQAVGSHCASQACLHLGVRRGDIYLDPLALLGPQGVVLKPLAGLSRTTPGPAEALSPDPAGLWSSGAETHRLVVSPGGPRGARMAQRSAEAGVAAAVAGVVASLLSALGSDS